VAAATAAAPEAWSARAGRRLKIMEFFNSSSSMETTMRPLYWPSTRLISTQCRRPAMAQRCRKVRGAGCAGSSMTLDWRAVFTSKA
jgi:hypothetical protein